MNTTAQRSPFLHHAIFFGFATSFTGWVLAYCLRLPGEVVPPVALGVSLLAIQLVGAVLAGRSAGANKAWLSGLSAGLVTSLINVLLLGSILTESGSGEEGSVSPALAIGGYLVFGAILGAIGGVIGGKLSKRPAGFDSQRNWLGRFAILTAVSGFSLLIAGGIVTSTGSGLAVPDWPSSFGANMFLFPLSKMTGGVFIEHAHRLLGVLVGLTTAALLVWTLMAKVRLTTKGLVVVASALVIVQAVLGGIRVTNTSTALAMIHGVTGQIFVALLALIAAMLSTAWLSDRKPTPHPLATAQRKLNAVALAALVMQIGFGAAVRHFDLQRHALMMHIGWSIVVMILLLAAGIRAQKKLGDEPMLRRLGTATKHSVLLQMSLGVFALGAAMMFRDKDPASVFHIALRTAHQAVGSVLLIAMTLLTTWTIRLTTRERSTAPRTQTNSDK